MYENCICVDLEDGGILLENVLTPHGIAYCIYLGTGGIYIILEDSDKPSSMYDYFRYLLGAVKIKLYFVGKGEYQVHTDSFCDEIDEEALNTVIYEHLYKMPQQYSQTAIERMKNILLKLDARSRGYYTDEEGNLFLFRNGHFFQASEIDSNRVFKLCLYGGMFGLHRFALGKWFSGLFYIFTCGFFLFGWLCDLFQLFFGFQKDKHKHLLQPITNRVSKLKYLPIGFIIGFVSLVCWLQLFRIPGTPNMLSFIF